MNKNRHTYRIQGQTFDKVGLLATSFEKLSSLSTPQWEREIWTFIIEWFSSKEIIEVSTSGSTGKPKSIELHKTFMTASAKATLEFLGLKPGDISVLCLPVKYIAGKMMIVRSLIGGLDLHFVEPVSTPYFEQMSRVDFCAMVPMQLKNILNKSGKDELEKIRKLIVGGGFMPYGLQERLSDVHTQIWQTYGMTETITHIALRRINGSESSDFYTPLPGVEIARDERNCLVISSANIGVEKLTTNDICEINLKGQFKILGRIDNVVNSGGVKLFPEVIEQKLLGFTNREFFVSSLPDNTLGEKLVIFIQGGQQQNREAFFLWQEMEKRLTGFEIPKEIIFKERIEKTISGKIIRR